MNKEYQSSILAIRRKDNSVIIFKCVIFRNVGLSQLFLLNHSYPVIHQIHLLMTTKPSAGKRTADL